MRLLGLLVLPCLAAPALAADTKPTPAQVEFFEKSVRPILAARCFECHGPEKHKGKLRLDSRGAMMGGGETGPAIVPGHPEKSLLVKAIGYKDDELKMPPKAALKPQEV